MLTTGWKFLDRAALPSDPRPWDLESSFSASDSPSFEAKSNLSLSEQSEQLHLRFPANPIDQDKDEDAVSHSSVSQLEAALEYLIVDIVNNGEPESLKPNSGTAVDIMDYHVCVTCTGSQTSDYQTWEWNGHIMVFHEGDGYVPEYVCGNFSQPKIVKRDDERACFGEFGSNTRGGKWENSVKF